MSEGFLQRWSRRKVQGEAAPPEEPRPPKAEPPQVVPAAGSKPPELPVAADANPDAAAQQAEAPPLTLEDTRSLTPESDFKPFMARSVAPEVRNAAMKKLFADPHFNVMDRMDVYIDDYSNPAPLPAAALRKMASAAFLKLVDDEEDDGKKRAVQETPAVTSVQDVAQSEHSLKDDPSPPAEAPDGGARPASQETDDDHADLRLQQDDAARAEDPRRGAA
jgi:hypothetical protein